MISDYLSFYYCLSYAFTNIPFAAVRSGGALRAVHTAQALALEAERRAVHVDGHAGAALAAAGGARALHGVLAAQGRALLVVAVAIG